jgi:hypothetical protein
MFLYLSLLCFLLPVIAYLYLRNKLKHAPFSPIALKYPNFIRCYLF